MVVIRLSSMVLYLKSILVWVRFFIKVIVTVIVQDSIVVGISSPKELISIDDERRDASHGRYMLRILQTAFDVDGKQNLMKDMTAKQDSFDRRFGSLQSSESRST